MDRLTAPKMEETSYVPFICALMCVFLVIIHLIYKKKISEGLPLPPGPPGWPIIGNLLQIGELPHRTMAKWNIEYGPLVYCRIGSTPTIVTSSPKMIKELLGTQDDTFASRPRTTQAKLMAYDDMNVGLAPYTAHWKLMRRICVEHLLTTRRMESFHKHRSEEASEMTRSIWKLSKEGRTINVRDHLGTFTMNIVTRMLIGKRYFGSRSMGQKEANEFRELIHSAINLHGVFYLPDHVPIVRLFGFSSYKKLFTEMGKKFDAYYSRIIEEHRHRQGAQSEGPKDFVDVLLNLSGEDGDLHLNDIEIKALIQDMVVGGTDTASFTMEWFMIEMIRNPHVMAKARKELDELLGEERVLQESDLGKVRYLRAAVKETFRLHPVGGFLIPHESIREAKVAGYRIPKKSTILVNTHGLGRNPDLWSNVEEFQPERFLDEAPTQERIQLRDSEYRLIPFGSGRRKCPGAQLGQSMLLLGLGRLIHQFEWSPPPNLARDDIDVMEVYGLTTPPRTALEALATPRLPSHLYSLQHITSSSGFGAP